MNKNLSVVFMGTPQFACSVLSKVIENYNVKLVVTQPDKEVGRKRILTPSPVKELAVKNNIEVFTPTRIKSEYQKVLDVKPDMIITCAYGQLIPREILDLPKYGCINVHASLLPKLRGGAPIHRAIIEGHKQTGITIMFMDIGMDSGDIITKSSIEINESDNLDTLNKKLSNLGANLLIETVPSIINNTFKREKQDENEVTFAKIITKEDELIDFNKPALDVYNQIRGLSSNPGAYFYLNGEVMKVYSAKIGCKCNKVNVITNIYKDGFAIGCLDNEIILTEIKPAGKNRILAQNYLNGIKKESFKESRINEK